MSVFPFLKHSSNLEACKTRKTTIKNKQKPTENKIPSIILLPP